MGNLAHALEQATGPAERGGCRIGRLLVSVDEEDKAALQAALDSNIPQPTLAKILTEQTDTRIGRDTVGNHRRGDCKCQELGLV